MKINVKIDKSLNHLRLRFQLKPSAKRKELAKLFWRQIKFAKKRLRLWTVKTKFVLMLAK